jgi:hypothetical membrane protein
MKRGTYWIGGALLLVGALQFILSLAIAESLRRGYSISSNYLSDLGVGHLAVLFNASVAMLGAFAILGAYFLFRSSKVHTLPYLIAVSGFGALGVGLFPETIGLPHLCFSIIAFVFGFLSAIYNGVIEKGAFRYFSLALGAVSCVALALSGSGTYLGLGQGGIERLVAYPILLWMIAFGAKSMSR